MCLRSLVSAGKTSSLVAAMILLHPNEQAGSRELASGHRFGTHRPAASEQQRDNCRPGRRHEVQC
jgi:hypothetical protein